MIGLPARRASGLRLARIMEQLTGDDARQQFLRRRAKLVRAGVVLRLIEQARELLRVEPRTAIGVADAAACIAQALGDGRLRALSLRAKANALSVAGRNAAAVDVHAEAIAGFEAAGDEQELARTLSAAIQPMILLGQYGAALDAAERAGAIFGRYGDELRVARLDINVGNLLHRQDRFVEAMNRYRSAHTRLQALGDPDGVLTALHNQAVTLTSLNDFHGALDAYQAARELATARNLAQAVSQADYNIAWLYYLRGEYSRAIELLHAAADASRQNGDGYHAALALLDLSEIYLELNLSADAREMGVQAEERFTELGSGYEAAKAAANIAIAHAQDGKAVLALELFADARRRLAEENNQAWPALIDVYCGFVLFAEGRLFEARREGLAALASFEASGLTTKAAQCHLLLARIALRLEDAAAAQRSCELALASIGAVETPALAFQVHLLFGHARLRAGDAAAARTSYEAARRALDALGSRSHGQDLKLAVPGERISVYEHLVKLTLAGDQRPGAIDEAFTCIEQAKARTLFDLMFQPVHPLGIEDGSESKLARSVRNLREELNWYYHRAEQEHLRPGEASANRLSQFRREIGSREEELARAMRQLGPEDRQHAALYEPAVRSADAIRGALPRDAVLLEYFQVGDSLVMALLDEHDLQVGPVANMPAVTRDVRTFQASLTRSVRADASRSFDAPHLAATQTRLRSLFDALLAPVWARVQGRPLVIVPHGVLHYVPFHALFDGQHYVADQCTVSYAPSASIYAQCNEAPAAAGPALVLGVSRDDAPFIEQEARAVASALPGARLFVGPAATEQVLRTHGRGSGVIHLASNGEVRADNPMFSAIGFGDTDLKVYDVYRLRLDAGVVTLSGCAPAANEEGTGDELLAMARGFLCAGAATVVLGLWNVEGGPSSALLPAFYRSIVEGASPASALQAAMSMVRAEFPHPHHGAPFVTIGRS